MTKLFAPIVEENKLHPSFKVLLQNPDEHPGKSMLEEIFAGFEDTDGNFLEQFQTTGFDARFFELYLFAVFRREGYAIERPDQKPDFIVEKDGHRVAVEVTTVNPSSKGALKDVKPLSEMTREELAKYEQHALPMKFGSSLYSKLSKKYWELEQCHGLPLVLFVEAFHDDRSLDFSSNALATYLYGLNTAGGWDQRGKLKVQSVPVEYHEVDGKKIPSKFFGLPDSENVSAVVFSNSGTLTKFSRMGFMHGYGNDRFKLIRMGTSFNLDPDAADSSLFRYDMDSPPFVEEWCNGLSVMHNPEAKHPLPDGFLGDVDYNTIQDGLFVTTPARWSPINSSTAVIDLHDMKQELDLIMTCSSGVVLAVPRAVFARAVGHTHIDHPRFEEEGWFGDPSESFYGVVVKFRESSCWGYFILGRSILGEWHVIKKNEKFEDRKLAVQMLREQMLTYLLHPRRYFSK